MLAEAHGPELLYHPERFDQMLGRDSFAKLDRHVLHMARSIFKASRNREHKFGMVLDHSK